VSTTTTLAILTAAALDEAAPGGDAASLAGASATLALLVGVILVLAGLLRLGFVANFISEPVLIGFKAGIGLVGGPFLVWHPSKYAELLAAKMKQHDARVWLVNTGWGGGAHGVGQRISLKNTRAIIEGIHSGALARSKRQRDPAFGFDVITECPGVPREILLPRDRPVPGQLQDLRVGCRPGDRGRRSGVKSTARRGVAQNGKTLPSTRGNRG
jgi:hypothetical protein